MFLVLLKVCIVATETANHQVLKMNWPHDNKHFLEIIEGPGFSLANWKIFVRNVVQKLL